jgi:hypothetical protein
VRRLLPLICILATLGLAVSCYPYIQPADAVVDVVADYLGPAATSGAVYEGRDREVDFPVLPFRLWGLDFEEELLFELGDHPLYAMIEITRVTTRDGREAWFALVSERTGLQHVVVGSAEAAALAETFPAPVHDGRLRVIRLHSDKALEYDTAFHLPNGELLQASITSKSIGEPPPKRNGNAMNHSADRVLAVLDLEEYNWARPVVFIEGQRAKVRLLAPFLPFAWRLEQTAGGLAWGAVNGQAGVGDVALVTSLDDVEEPTWWRWERRGDLLVLVGQDRVTDHLFFFRALAEGPDGPLELVRVEVRHGDTSVVHLEFNPALPDLRWLPDRAYRGLVVAGSNGRDGYMTGRFEVRAEDGRAVVDVVPERPFWACERPIRGRVQYIEDAIRLRSEITPELAAGGLGRDACFELDKE